MNDYVVYNSAMEMANSRWLLRPGREEDKGRVLTLLQRAERRHLHVDWRLPGDWFDIGVSVVAERDSGKLAACLILGADPPPAAWVRLCALLGGADQRSLFGALFDAALPPLRRSGVSQLGWLPQRVWPRSWMREVGFEIINEVETFLKQDLEIPPDAPDAPAAVVRPVQPGDFPRLAAIEAAAFDPLWRHSAKALELGLRQSISFNVAELDGRLVGFQYSVPGDEEDAAHLVRLTVSPDVQRRGVGSSLLTAAIDTYRQRGLYQISLNTQADNLASQRLYQKFGFTTAGYRLPVWSMEL